MGALTPDSPTLLVITPISGGEGPQLTPYSARGLTQTYQQIAMDGDTVDRDINGNLVDLTYPQFRKYRVTVTCKDGTTPAFDGAWRGMIVEVACAFEFSYRTGFAPQRPEVSGSSRTEGDFTYYRPLLTCRVMDIRNGLEEYQAEYAWQIDLEEI